MTTGYLHLCAALLAMSACLAPLPTAAAQPGDLNSIASTLARRYHAQIRIDPAIVPTYPPKVPGEGVPAERALDQLVTTMSGIAWRRVYLAPSQLQKMPPEKLAATVRLLDPLEPGSLVIENTVTKLATLFRKNRVPSPAFKAELEAGEFGPEPIYLLFSTHPSSDSPAIGEQLADLQRQQMEIDASPDQTALAMLQMMQMLQSMEPAAREPFMGRTYQAGIRLWEATPPQQRQEMIQESMQVMRRFHPVPGGAPGGAGDVLGAAGHRSDGGSPRSYLRELKGVADSLAALYEVTVVVDPALLVTLPPKAPDEKLTIDRALDTLAAALNGAAWRRVYLTPAQLRKQPPPEKLAAAVRLLDPWDEGRMVIENPATKLAMTLQKSRVDSPVFQAEREAGQFSPAPIYLLYSTSASNGSRTMEERFADLQRRQMRLMTAMTPEQMAQSMQQIIQTYQFADPATRSRLMGLPVMAGMMAVWFPRAALESKGPGVSTR